MDRQPWLCWGSQISIDGNTSRSGIVKPNLAEAVGKLTWPWGAPPTMKGQHQFRECVQSTGLYSEDRTRNVTIHTLRHTFGSQLPIQGIPLRRIQELIGHEAITTGATEAQPDTLAIRSFFVPHLAQCSGQPMRARNRAFYPNFYPRLGGFRVQFSTLLIKMPKRGLEPPRPCGH